MGHFHLLRGPRTAAEECSTVIYKRSACGWSNKATSAVRTMSRNFTTPPLAAREGEKVRPAPREIVS
jgi:hypothetical protein